LIDRGAVLLSMAHIDELRAEGLTFDVMRRSMGCSKSCVWDVA